MRTQRLKRHPYHAALRAYPWAAILTHAIAAALGVIGIHFLRSL